MKTLFTAREIVRAFRLTLSAALIAMLAFACVSPAAAQKDKKKKSETQKPADSTNPLVPMSDENQIDYMISEMLGAWQVADVEKLHKDYADDVTVVNGAYAPPIMGWTNYLAIYQQQRTRMQRVRMDRSNTVIKVAGNVAWACYQWDFEATLDGVPATSQGQTTLVMEKRNNHWIIVHNHTSMVPSPNPGSTTGTGTPPRAQQDQSKPRSN
ncbi:MAG TPA: nuclear transport factor 2 family protein [Candidatus Acidoferrales bacterium]|jgi:ketosteroid isomerase-like protein|nr:nuclear transport factor 2 family protein [Candidatus Acidoferrales bacterium]